MRPAIRESPVTPMSRTRLVVPVLLVGLALVAFAAARPSSPSSASAFAGATPAAHAISAAEAQVDASTDDDNAPAAPEPQVTEFHWQAGAGLPTGLPNGVQ